MIVRVTSAGRITLPPEVLESLGVKPGDELELKESPDGYVLRPKLKIDYSSLAPLRDKIPPEHPPFDIHKFREEICAPKVRD